VSDVRPAETPKTSNRFNSLDSGILLNSPITSDLPAELQAITESQSSNAATLTFARAPKAKPSSIGRSISFGPATALTSPLEPAPQIMKAHSMVPTGDNTGCVASPPPILRASSLAPVGNNTGLLAPPLSAPKDTNASNSGSIAVRAMRSMKSLATISSWAQLKDGSVRGVPKEKAPKETADPKPAKTKVKAKKGKKAKADTLRVASGSSFEAGALSVPEIPAAQAQSERVKEKDLGERKRSVLGLGMGWPSTLRSASSPVPPSPVVTVSAPLPEPEVSAPVQRPPPSAFASQRISSTEPKRLSGESNISTSSPEGNVAVTVGRSRAGSRSTMSSTTSSLRPLSTASGHSAGSCGSSAVSIRWDEEGLATVKEARERDRATRRGPRGESRRGSEERRRTSLTSVFPETAEHIRPASRQDKDDEDEAPMMPTVNIETATTVDGHSIREEIESDYEQDDSSSMTRTPNKLPRPRPLSEQLLRQMRPRGITSDSEGKRPLAYSLSYTD
jgi:serine/arginine repetitive matrix protein 2